MFFRILSAANWSCLALQPNLLSSSSLSLTTLPPILPSSPLLSLPLRPPTSPVFLIGDLNYRLELLSIQLSPLFPLLPSPTFCSFSHILSLVPQSCVLLRSQLRPGAACLPTQSPLSLPSPCPALLSPPSPPPKSSSCMFFFGNLNYCLPGAAFPSNPISSPPFSSPCPSPPYPTASPARALLAKRDWEALLQHDQELSQCGGSQGGIRPSSFRPNVDTPLGNGAAAPSWPSSCVTSPPHLPATLSPAAAVGAVRGRGAPRVARGHHVLRPNLQATGTMYEMRHSNALLPCPPPSPFPQLRWELSEGGALPGWREGPIFFAPTYKYAAGSNRYVGEDEEDGEKRRTPAWCDRVLWYDSGDATDSLPPTSISSLSPSTNTTTTGITSSGSMSSMGGYASDALQLVSYSRAELALSDHRPVAAVFAVGGGRLLGCALCPCHAANHRAAQSRHHVLSLPCTLSTFHPSPTSVSPPPPLPPFSHQVPYASVIRRTIELHNLGTVPARFSVAPAGSTDTAAPGPAGGCGAWVVAEPAAGAVAPGHTVTLSLHTWVAVPGTRVDLLVDRGGLLDLILVVAIAGGGDLFVACSGSYVPSCWGLRLEALAGLKDPIRSLSLDAIATRQRSTVRYSRATAASAAGGHQASIPEASETDPDNDDHNDSAAAGGEDDRLLGGAARAAAPHASDAFEVPKEVARMLTFLLDSGQDISSAFDPIALGIDLSLEQEDTSRAPQFPSSHSTPHGHPHSLSHTRSASLSSDVLSAAVSSLSTTPESSFNSNPGSSSISSSPGGGGSSSFGSSRGSGGGSATGGGGVLPQLSRTLSRGGVAGLSTAAALAVAAAAGAVGAAAGAVGAAAADLAAGATAAGGGGGGAGGAGGAGEGDGPGSTQFLAAKAAALGAVAQELQIAPIRLALDTGTPFPTETSPLTMARALVSFLLALPEPIIPPAVGEEVACREGWARGAAAMLLAERLGAVQLGVVDSLLALIQALLRNRIANRLAIYELGMVYSVQCSFTGVA
ncbi:unnamed protein product [Closterium sp. NIES-54]